MTSPYHSPRLAFGYAYERPPVHRRIIEIVARRLALDAPVRRALDIGCGAGVSTAALAPLATTTVGLEPVAAMLAHRRDVAPGAAFAIGEAERLPFAPGAYDLVTAAGSINYTNISLFLAEAARVLAQDGTLVIYDFAAGRRLRGSARLDEWYATFERRYPPQPGYAIDARALAYGEAGLSLDAYEEMELAVPMTPDAYLRYAMSETNVELAIAAGEAETGIREWCRTTLGPVFGGAARDVLFSAYAAFITTKNQEPRTQETERTQEPRTKNPRNPWNPGTQGTKA